MPRDNLRWPGFDSFVTNIDSIPIHAETALFYRERNSHKGISCRKSLRRLAARQINQEFLEEICKLEQLEELRLENVSSFDLRPLQGLKKLRVLKVSNAPNLSDFSVLAELSTLEGLYVENAKNLTQLNFLTSAHHLIRIGIEGGMYTKCSLRSVSPLSGLKGLESLFMTSVSLEDQSLLGLAECKRLSELSCARFAPKREFQELRRVMPKLVCRWCDNYELTD